MFELQEAKRRAHILEGLKIIVEYKDEYLKKILPPSKDKASLKETIEERFKLTPDQSEAIVILPNYRFSGLEREKIVEEFNQITEQIKALEGLLGSEKKLVALVKQELEEVRTKFGDKRLTKVTGEEEEVDTLDLIPDDPCFVAVTAQGFLKRYGIDSETNAEDAKKRMVIAGDDVVIDASAATLHTNVLSVYSDGTAYCLQAHLLPNMRRYAKGTALHELLALKEPIAAKFVKALRVKNLEAKDLFVVLVTKEGTLKKIPVSELAAIRRSGVTLMRLRKKDELKAVLLVKDNSKIALVTEQAKAFVVPVSQIPVHAKGISGGFMLDSLKGTTHHWRLGRSCCWGSRSRCTSYSRQLI
jgi:DNA gyrase subunit A